MEEKSKDGFTQVTSRRKKPPKKPSRGTDKKIPTSNSFDALNHLPDAKEVENPHKPGHQRNDKGKAKQSPDPILEKITTPCSSALEDVDKVPGGEGDSVMYIDEQDLTDIDLEKLEDAFNKKELQSIPVKTKKSPQSFHRFHSRGNLQIRHKLRS